MRIRYTGLPSGKVWCKDVSPDPIDPERTYQVRKEIGERLTRTPLWIVVETTKSTKDNE